MVVKKIAITVPPLFLKRLDEQAKTAGKTRSRFIVDELEQRLRQLEDEEVTRLYDQVYEDAELAEHDYRLAEEMLEISSIHEEKEKW